MNSPHPTPLHFSMPYGNGQVSYYSAEPDEKPLVDFYADRWRPTFRATDAAVLAGQRYRLLDLAMLRAGFELTSDTLGALEPGEVITALETRVNGDGILRVRCSFGWLSERAADGTTLLAEVPDGESSTGSESEESGTESKESAEDKAF